MPGMFRAAGLLLPMGFGQGPGQANNIGASYQTLGFEGGHSFGLAIAAAGYLVACLIGVIILNVLRKKGLITVDEDEVKGELCHLYNVVSSAAEFNPFFEEAQ